MKPRSAVYSNPFFPFVSPRDGGTDGFNCTNDLRVRLARGGSKKRPFFNIHVCDSRTRRDGRFIERLGYYNPVAAGQATRLVVDLERLAFWQSNGAQLSDTVARLVKEFKAQPAAEAPAAE